MSKGAMVLVALVGGIVFETITDTMIGYEFVGTDWVARVHDSIIYLSGTVVGFFLARWTLSA